ncbi:uncharacterized protein LOC135708663 [Ochlerotatus camptorhynchus]|uniref:uncharacterized protein LOC135708663 n=1 Tax=Ochlerotatus camptorhynchus TaxID=644619 RepID=UPI0031DFB218
MFHQVLIREEDQRYQCFFWTNENGNLAVYAMRVMTFGACCSPSSAQYVKNVNAERFKNKYPAPYGAITKSHYVDDMLISVANEEDAIQTAKDVRVAPLKLTSIPRLELQAAVIGTRLTHTIIETLSIIITRKFYWSDSRDVLCWINSDHRRYTQFVGFRVTEILEATEAHEWRYVPSKLNVVDDGTKWDVQPDLSPESRWFKGPDFLWTTEDKWPQSAIRNEPTDAELVANLSVHYALPKPIVCVLGYSSWEQLRNVVARVLRFTTNCCSKQRKQPIKTGPLIQNELYTAEVYLIRLAQQEGYPEEFIILRGTPQNAGEPTAVLPRSSSLYKLTPWLDEHAILRMRTRIAACQYTTEDAKKPIILPHNHETVINELRQKYQIGRLRSCFNQARRDCQKCKIEQAAPNPPFMADLPPGRLAAFSRPFTHTGVDYFGPTEVFVGWRVEKRWGMLATCLTVRAIHIEVVHSLPRKFYSDRGTNFVGVDRELKKLEEVINHDEIMKEFTSSGTIHGWKLGAANTNSKEQPDGCLHN